MTRGGDALAARRRAYAREIVGPDGAAALVDAFAHVPREHFLGPPPWRVLDGASLEPAWTDDPQRLCQDALVAICAERGINNGQPSLHARGIAACALQPGDTAVHIGAGTGYYSAILAEQVGRGGTVVAYEIEPDLARRAQALLAHDWPQVRVVAASATETALPPADAVYVSAGATHPPDTWLDALRPGGRLVFPLTPDLAPGPMLLITRRGAHGYAARVLMRVSFIGCIGARDPDASRKLRAALATRDVRDIRSLRRHTPPDDSAWCDGDGWWLSTAEAATT